MGFRKDAIVVNNIFKFLSSKECKHREMTLSSIVFVVSQFSAFNTIKNSFNKETKEDIAKGHELLKSHSDGIFIGRNHPMYDEVKKLLSKKPSDIEEELKHKAPDMIDPNYKIIKSYNRNNEPIYYQIDEYGKKRRVSKKYAELYGFEV